MKSHKQQAKRSSINSYNKRVVELNLHQPLSPSALNLKHPNTTTHVDHNPTSAKSSKHISLDISEIV